MTQVNLLPPEVRTRQRVRRYTVVAIGAVAAVVVLIMGVFALQSYRLSQTSRSLATQEQANRALQRQIQTLQPFDQLRQQVVQGEALTGELLNGQVLWSGVLRNVSSALPGGLWLSSMNGTLNATTAGVSTSAAGAQQVVGSIQFQGQAFEHTTVGAWLTRLEQVPGWVNAWVSSSNRGADSEGKGTSKQVTFSNTVDLSADATTHGRQL
jgi:Tfp pilus assembly protein PilN